MIMKDLLLRGALLSTGKGEQMIRDIRLRMDEATERVLLMGGTSSGEVTFGQSSGAS